MKMHIEIDAELLNQAKKLSGIENNSVLITKALELFISIKNQAKLLELRGKIEFDDAAFE